MYAQAYIAAKDAARNELAALMASFTGRILVVSHTERAPYERTSHRPCQAANERRIKEAKKREAAKEKDRQIVEQAKALASEGLSTLQAGRIMRKSWPGAGMSEPKLEQLAAKHGFVFPYKGDKA